MTIHWYRADVTRPTHPKVKKLARRLGVSRMHAIGIHDVLCVIPTVAGRSDGFLGSMDAEDLAIAVDWEGDPEILLGTLIDLAIVDQDPDGTLYVHGFAERATKEAAKREADRDRKRAGRRVQDASAPTAPLSESCPTDVQRTALGQEPMSRGNLTRTNVRTNGRTERESTRTPDEVIPPAAAPTTDGEPSLSLDDPGGLAEASPLPTPAPEADRPADAKPGPLPRAVDAEADDRLRRAMAQASDAPPPPEDLLDETNGPWLAIEAYNAARHLSLPEAATDRGTRGAVWVAIRNDRAEARLARERGDPEPEHGLHRLAGWRDLGERTRTALFLQPSKTEPCMRPTPGVLFFVEGQDGRTGDQHRTKLYQGDYDERYRRGAAGGPSKPPSVANAESIAQAQQARIERDMARARERDANYKPVKPPPGLRRSIFGTPVTTERRDDADPNTAA